MNYKFLITIKWRTAKHLGHPVNGAVEPSKSAHRELISPPKYIRQHCVCVCTARAKVFRLVSHFLLQLSHTVCGPSSSPPPPTPPLVLLVYVR